MDAGVRHVRHPVDQGSLLPELLREIRRLFGAAHHSGEAERLAVLGLRLSGFQLRLVPDDIYIVCVDVLHCQEDQRRGQVAADEERQGDGAADDLHRPHRLLLLDTHNWSRYSVARGRQSTTSGK